MAGLVLNRKECSATHCVEQVFNVSGNDIEIYDVIVPWKYDADDPSVSIQDITNALKEADGPLTVRINCRGGEVGTSLNIYNSLRDYPHNVTTIVVGYAFSAGGWIAQAGDVRNIANGGIFMIHNPQMFPEIKSLDDLESVKNQWIAHQTSILNIFESRVEIPVDEIKNLMEKETFLPASEAIDMGFFDGLHESPAKLDALNYAAPDNLPQKFRDSITQTTNVEQMESLKEQKNRLLEREAKLLFR